MATYFVSNGEAATAGVDASGGGRGGISLPWLTQTYAWSQMSPGDQLFVRGGTFPEGSIDQIPSGSGVGSETKISAYPGETVWLAPTSGDRVLYFGTAHYIQFDGINIDGDQGITDAAIFFDDRSGDVQHHIRFANAVIHHREGPGQGNAAVLVCGHDNEFTYLSVHGTGGPYGFYVHGDDNIIDHCDIYEVSTSGVHIYHNGAAPGFVDYPHRTIVRYCLIHDISESWFFGSPDPQTWGILASGYDSLIHNNCIFGNTVAYTDSTNSGIYVYFGPGHRLYHNTIYANVGNGIVIGASADGTEVFNNILYLNTQTAFVNGGTSTTSGTNLTTNPTFVNAAGADFRLQAGSAAIGTGTDVGFGLDIGALAYSSATATGTLHLDGSNPANVFTATLPSGAHPADNGGIGAWDDVERGVAALAASGPTSPIWRSSVPLMRLPCVSFNGTDQYLQVKNDAGTSTPALSTFITSTAFTMFGAFRVAGVTTNEPIAYDNVAMLANDFLDWGILFRNTGTAYEVVFYAFDGSVKTVTLPILLDVSYTFMFRLEGGTLYASLNGGTPTTTACGAIANLTGGLQIGRNPWRLQYFNGRIGEVVLFNGALSSTDIATYIAAFNGAWLPAAAASAAIQYYYAMAS